jgi:tetraacyldisaccharide 4'-kinase
MKSSDILKISLLWPLSLAYALVMELRAGAYKIGLFRSHKSSVPVISIGNIVAGGTGKTPMAIYVAQVLMHSGLRPAVLSRGYKRKSRTSPKEPLVVSNGAALQCGVETAGDEPFLMASRLLGTEGKPGAMVIVGRDRVAGAEKAVELGAQVIVLDDGFQHLRLKRDLDIVLLDSQRPYDNGWLLPAGMLREPSMALKRADIVISTRRDEAVLIKYNKSHNVPTYKNAKEFLGFFTNHKATNILELLKGQLIVREIGILANKKIMLLSGIARPASFRKSIEMLGYAISEELIYPDHYNYRAKDLMAIRDAAKNVDCILTTEKDIVRFPREWDPEKSLYAMQIEVEFVKEEDKFEQIILSTVIKPS